MPAPKVESAEIAANPVSKVEEPRPPVKKSTTQIPSLATLKTKISSKIAVPESDSTPAEDYDDSKSEETFSKDDLDKYWQEFIEIKKANGKDQEIMLLKEPYSLEANKVVINLSNEVLNITFNHLKADLQGFLRKALKNNKILLEAVVEETAREDMIYTNKEKYAHLAKKHPVLNDLQEKLGLDPDY